MFNNKDMYYLPFQVSGSRVGIFSSSMMSGLCISFSVIFLVSLLIFERWFQKLEASLPHTIKFKGEKGHVSVYDSFCKWGKHFQKAQQTSLQWTGQHHLSSLDWSMVMENGIDLNQHSPPGPEEGLMKHWAARYWNKMSIWKNREFLPLYDCFLTSLQAFAQTIPST